MKLQWHRCMSSDGDVPERKDSQQPPSLGAVRNNRGFDHGASTQKKQKQNLLIDIVQLLQLLFYCIKVAEKLLNIL